jgi:hypothetical protein
MKVSGANSVGSTASGARPKAAGAAGDGFRLPSTASTSATSQAGPTTGVSGVMSLDALIALQDVGGPLERRRRAVGRAGRLLDILDGVKLGLLSGELSLGDLDRLKRAIRDQRDQTDEPALEGVLDEIETRAEVELAKLEQSRRVS